MVIDTSAVMAILMNEPERRGFNEAIEAAATRFLSAASLVEVSIVTESRAGAAGLREFDDFLDTAGVEIIAVDLAQAMEARRAFRLYGKGNHPAGLNFGDCFSYALAKLRGESLLFKGEDFSKTDVMAAV